MKDKAVVGLVKSRMAYARDWPDVGAPAEGEDEAERVFDLSEVLTENGVDVPIDLATLGRNLPFPLFAVVATGEGVFIIAGGEDSLYAYCYTSKVPLLAVYFTADGWNYEGWKRTAGGAPELVRSDEELTRFAEAVSTIVGIVERACEDTRHVLSYTLNRAERRRAAKSCGVDTLGATLIHHVCLDQRAKESFVVVIPWCRPRNGCTKSAPTGVTSRLAQSFVFALIVAASGEQCFTRESTASK